MKREKIEIRELEREYLGGTDSMWCEDSDRLLGLKRAIAGLSAPDRRIILLVSELGTQAEAARFLGVSADSISKVMCRLRKRLGQYRKTKDICKR